MKTADRPIMILVVDDLSDNRLLIRHIFEEFDYLVLEARDGAEGIEVARTARPDCILLDINMPVMTGFEALDRLQQDPRTREIPVVVLTATADDLTGMERALARGAVDYITKPISPQRVVARVRGAIERQRLVRELEELRASFTSMLVHDLRAPLTVIKGYAELLAHAIGANAGEKPERYVRVIRESSERMIRLIGEILDISKLEAGKLKLEPRPVDPVAIATSVAERFGPAVAKRQIKLEVRPARLQGPVHCDPDRLDQIFMNLIGNAVKFTPEGGRIDVEIADLGEEMEGAVADTGPGIPAEELPLLFEKFSQTSSARATSQPGTGLGLLICRHLVEAHGGRIWAESVPGRGARFAFRLPRQARSARGHAGDAESAT